MGQDVRPLVIATGVRSNGTSLLYRILCTGDTFPLHIPAFPPWLRGRDWAVDFPTALFVVITRDLDCAAQSALARGLNATRSEAWAEQSESGRYLRMLSQRLGTRAFHVTYETLVRDPAQVIRDITAFLRTHGYDGPALTLPEPVYDANAKWQGKAA